MSAQVWWSGDAHARVHETPSCRILKSYHQKRPLKLVGLDAISTPLFCRTCFPDAPRIKKIPHLPCDICSPNRAKPCEHNGGVLVVIKRHDSYPTSSNYTRYVWPETAAAHTVVNSAQMG
jgi:hypothetical protein